MARDTVSVACASTSGLYCDKQGVMVQRLTIAIVLLLAVLSASAPQSVRACAMAMPGLQKAPCTDCCARMKFCVLRQEKQVPPASATASSQQSITLAAQPIESLLG